MTKAIEINTPIWLNCNFVPCNQGGESPVREFSGEYQNTDPGARMIAVSVGINVEGHEGAIQAWIIGFDERHPDEPDPNGDWKRVAMSYVSWESLGGMGVNLFQTVTFTAPMGWFYKVTTMGQIDIMHEWVEWNFYTHVVRYEE